MFTGSNLITWSLQSSLWFYCDTPADNRSCTISTACHFALPLMLFYVRLYVTPVWGNMYSGKNENAVCMTKKWVEQQMIPYIAREAVY